MTIDRRQFIHRLGIAGIGAAAAWSRPRSAYAATVDGKRSALLLIMMNGGYAPIQTSARSFIDNSAQQMSFGCTSANISVRDEISYDTSTWGQLPSKALDRLGSIGSIGASNHNSAQHFWEGAQGGLRRRWGRRWAEVRRSKRPPSAR